MMRFSAVAFSLFLACSAFGRVVVHENPVSEAKAGVGSATSGRAMAAGNDEGTFLVTWLSQWRGGQAMRVNAAGESLDATPIGLPIPAGFTFWNGEHWITVSDQGWVRISRDGVLLDPEARSLNRTNETYLAATWTGRALLLAYYQLAEPRGAGGVVTNAGGPNLTVVSYDADMNPTHSTLLVETVSDPRMAMASDGETAIIFYHEDRPAPPRPQMVALFNADGAFLRKAPTNNTGNDIVAIDGHPGGGYLAVTRPRTLSRPFSAYLVGHDLVLKSIGDLFSAFATVTSVDSMPWDGQAFNLFYLTDKDIRVLRLGADGARLEDRVVIANGAPTSSNTSLFAEHSAGSLVLLRTTAASAASLEYFLQSRVAEDAAALATAADRGLEVGGFAQETPVAASTAAQSLVLWRERTTPNGPLPLLGTRVARDGSVVDAQPLQLAGSTCNGSRASVATDGTGFLAAWLESDSVRFAQVRADGTIGVRGGMSLQVPCTARGVAAAPLVLSNGSGYLVVWRVPTQQFEDPVHAARVSASGVLLDSFPIVLGESDEPLRGASNGSGYLVTFADRLVRVSAAGVKSPAVFAGLGASRVTAVWWNGTSYSLLHTEGSTLRIARTGATSGVAIPTTAELNLSGTETWGVSLDAACDAAGCSLPRGTVEDGLHVLRDVRAEDNGAAASVRLGDPVVVPPALAVEDFTGEAALMAIAPLRVPGGRLYAAYVRRSLESPAAGAPRIFIRPMEGGRMRAARR